LIGNALNSPRPRRSGLHAEMWRYLATLIGIVFGIGVTGASAPPRETHLSVTLSDSDVATIKTALIAEWRGPGSPEFAKIIASSNTEGAITVCGFERAKVVSGSNTGMQPFVGVLSRRPWRFYVTASSNHGTMAPAVLALCRGRALQLVPE
jgi:hypothetical protein